MGSGIWKYEIDIGALDEVDRKLTAYGVPAMWGKDFRSLGERVQILRGNLHAENDSELLAIEKVLDELGAPKDTMDGTPISDRIRWLGESRKQHCVCKCGGAKDD